MSGQEKRKWRKKQRNRKGDAKVAAYNKVNNPIHNPINNPKRDRRDNKQVKKYNDERKELRCIGWETSAHIKAWNASKAKEAHNKDRNLKLLGKRSLGAGDGGKPAVRIRDNDIHEFEEIGDGLHP